MIVNATPSVCRLGVRSPSVSLSLTTDCGCIDSRMRQSHLQQVIHWISVLITVSMFVLYSYVKYLFLTLNSQENNVTASSDICRRCTITRGRCISDSECLNVCQAGDGGVYSTENGDCDWARCCCGALC
jgi:hypothetical protein